MGEGVIGEGEGGEREVGFRGGRKGGRATRGRAGMVDFVAVDVAMEEGLDFAIGKGGGVADALRKGGHLGRRSGMRGEEREGRE